MPGQPKKEISDPKLLSRKCMNVDEEDGNGMQKMFRMMVAYCERTTDMLGEVWGFQQEQVQILREHLKQSDPYRKQIT